jgi:uncharacterized membrane protein YfcA
MTTMFAQILSTDGLIWMICAALVAGIVRGFAGFGTAMIFLPVAGQFLSPFWAITVLTVMDIFGPFPLVRRAWRDAHRPDLRRLTIAMVITLPLALMVLSHIDPQVFRYLVSALSLGMLVILGLGLRYRGELRPPFVYGVGGLGGITGGLVGIPGPPVILFYMASPHPPWVIRANNLLYLLIFDAAILFYMAMFGEMTKDAILIGVIMVPSIMIGNMIGARFFDPDKEKAYRTVAFVIIGCSAMMGLPLFD